MENPLEKIFNPKEDLKSLKDVLVHEIQDLYSAEKQITEALPLMAKGATSSKLKAAFENHLKQTNEQVERLEEVAELIGCEVGGHKCKGMEGLLKEGNELLAMDHNEVLDAALIGAAQRVEHYEIAGYGCAITYAKLLKMDKVADILKKTIAEEEDTDKLLTTIAEKEVNKNAEDAEV